MTAVFAGKVAALSGGVGGARFLHGIDRALPPGALTAIVNTGDDFEHWGLHISPDIDTVMYTLSNMAPVERGWGIEGETFNALAGIKRFGGEDWFALGDRDLATHIMRNAALKRGNTLTNITVRLCGALGIHTHVLPMADGPCRTMVETVGEGTLSFQDWFVKRRTEPVVKSVRFEGQPDPAPGVIAAIHAADIVLIGPSNPYVSIDPILSLPGVRAAIQAKPVVAVSPIVGGHAVKGPLAAMIRQLAHREPAPDAITAHYDGLLNGIVVENGDEGGISGEAVLATSTVMRTRDDSLRLARETLAFAAGLGA